MQIVLEKLTFPPHLEDKIFEIEFDIESSALSKIVSYFPLTRSERKEVCELINDELFNEFHSIFSDTISEEEWNRTKEQIKTKFKSELFDIDNFP